MSHHIHESKIKELEEKANEARQLLIPMLVEAGSGHTAGPLGKFRVGKGILRWLERSSCYAWMKIMFARGRVSRCLA